MASITNRKLKITVNKKKKTALCVVTGRVRFTTYERSQMKAGLRFRLSCALWEDDPVWDDHIYNYWPNKTYTGKRPASVAFRFSARLGVSKLDDEWGTDEIYGLLKLRNGYTGSTVKGRTNVIKRKF